MQFVAISFLFSATVCLTWAAPFAPDFEHHRHEHEQNPKLQAFLDKVRKHINVSSSMERAGPASCANVQVQDRIDCYPELGSNSGNCEARGCCWVPYNGGQYSNTPWCFFPPDYPDYNIENIQDSSGPITFDAKRTTPTFRPNDILNLKGTITCHQGGISRLRLVDPANQRWEVPIPIWLPPTTKCDSKLKLVKGDSRLSSLKLVDPVTGESKIELKDKAPIIYADQFIQLNIKLDSPRLFGIGERYGPLMLNPDSGWVVTALWATDRAPGGMAGNLYGTHPIAFTLDDNGKAQGIFALNSNYIEFITSPGPTLTIRTIGGIVDFFFFNGEPGGSGYPSDMIAQYWRVIHNNRPIQMPPYWALGFHLCRWGYNTDTKLIEVINRNRAAKIPYDTQWIDIDYMIRQLDWTYDPNNFGRLPSIVRDIHSYGMKLVPIADPAIGSREPPGSYPPYDRGLQKDVFIKFKGKNAEGKVWPGETVFPDFTATATTEWWYQDGKDFYDKLGGYDGIWIDMNEPANFMDGVMGGCAASNDPDGGKLDNPPYGNRLFGKTICLSCKQNISTHYNLHNMYGYHEAIASYKMMEKLRPKERPFVLTRSSYAGVGVYAHHWTGDVRSSWGDLALSIPSTLMFQFFGVPFVGADVCGFGGDSTEELCIRWSQLGAFYTFMRNHNDKPPREQDPAVWSQFAVNAIRSVTEMRYTLLPYFYTLFFRAHQYNEIVMRPVFWIAPFDKETHAIDKQLMLGDGLLITPVLSQGMNEVRGYFPRNTVFDRTQQAKWYDFKTGASLADGGWQMLSAPLDQIPVHVRGGAILPLQPSAVTTGQARKNNFQLLVALSSADKANGSLYIDDSISPDSISGNKYSYIEFTASKTSVQSTVVAKNYNPETAGESVTLSTIFMYGVASKPNSASISGRPIDVQYNFGTKTATFNNVNVKLIDQFTLTIAY